MDNSKLKISQLSSKLQQLIDKTYKLLDETENSEIKQQLVNELKALKNRDELRIAFVGQYSSGKSTIISALTGNKDIKIEANVATDVVSEYRWNNIVLMDTPGILAGKVEQHDARTKEALNECDLIVYVLTSQLFDDIIFNNFIDLAYEQKLSDKMLIAINKMSMEAGEFETLQKNYTESIHSIFKERGYEFNFDVVFIDAADYIEGTDENDNEFIELSNFNKFIADLNDFVEKKGLIKKQFDTPIRVLKSHISSIALSQVNPEIATFNNQFLRRLQRSMRDMERRTDIALMDFEQNSIEASSSVRESIGELTKEDMERAIDNLNKTIKENLYEITKKIEEVVEEEYQELMADMEDFNNKEALITFSSNLERQINSPSISPQERINLENQQRFIEILKQGGSKVSSMATNVNSTLSGGLGQFTGSQLHSGVLKAGHFFGHKFKPWEAVKITGKIGKFAKFGVPAIATFFTVALDIHAKRKEEQRIRDIAAAKQQFDASCRSSVKDTAKQIKDEFYANVLDNYKAKQAELEQQKDEIMKETQKNNIFIKSIKNLESEYVDFIEIIENEPTF